MADRILRAGYLTVDFQYANNCDSIGAENMRVAIVDGEVILKFVLRPVDGNQRDDEEYLHNHSPLSVQIRDEQAVTRLRKFLTARTREIKKGLALEIVSRSKTLYFEVKRKQFGEYHLFDLVL